MVEGVGDCLPLKDFAWFASQGKRVEVRQQAECMPAPSTTCHQSPGGGHKASHDRLELYASHVFGITNLLMLCTQPTNCITMHLTT